MFDRQAHRADNALSGERSGNNDDQGYWDDQDGGEPTECSYGQGTPHSQLNPLSTRMVPSGYVYPFPRWSWANRDADNGGGRSKRAQHDRPRAG